VVGYINGSFQNLQGYFGALEVDVPTGGVIGPTFVKIVGLNKYGGRFSTNGISGYALGGGVGAGAAGSLTWTCVVEINRNFLSNRCNQ